MLITNILDAQYVTKCVICGTTHLIFNFTLVKEQSRLDVRKYSFSQRTINGWNKLSTNCVHASNVNNVKEYNRQVSRKGGFTIRIRAGSNLNSISRLLLS